MNCLARPAAGGVRHTTGAAFTNHLAGSVRNATSAGLTAPCAAGARHATGHSARHTGACGVRHTAMLNFWNHASAANLLGHGFRHPDFTANGMALLTAWVFAAAVTGITGGIATGVTARGVVDTASLTWIETEAA